MKKNYSTKEKENIFFANLYDFLRIIFSIKKHIGRDKI